MKERSRTSFWLYILGSYILLQFLWWAWLLIDQSNEISILNQQFTSAGKSPPEIESLDRRILMVLGEGVVFISLLILGFLKVKSTLKKELNLAGQQRNFILSITHELNTPIAGIKLFLQTLKKRDLPEEDRDEIVDNMLIESSRLEDLVQNILTTARLEEGKLELESTNIDLTNFISEHTRSVEHLLSDRVLRVDLEKNVKVRADEFALRSILLNLLENAKKYSDPGSCIEIRLKELSKKVVISISDEGSGIESDQQELIFQKFYRVQNELTRTTQGTGLGLYIVAQLVKLQHGTIQYFKNNPHGSVFEISFPKA